MYSTPQLSFQVPIEQVVRAYSINKNPVFIPQIIGHYHQHISNIVLNTLRAHGISSFGVIERRDYIGNAVCHFADVLPQFDPERASLKTFVEMRIRGSVIDLLRKNGHMRKTTSKRAREYDRFEHLGEDAYQMAANSLKTTPEKIKTAVNIRDNGQISLDDLADDAIPRTTLTPEEVAASNEYKRLVRRALLELPKAERMVLIGIFYHGISAKDIGSSGYLGKEIDESRVNQLKRRGLQKLSERLSSLN